MNGGVRRQLPSWMQRPSTVEQASISEVKRDNKNSDSEILDNRAVQPLKNVQRKKRESRVALVESNSSLLEKGEARKRGKKAVKEEGDQSGTTQLGNEPHVLKRCRTSKRKRISNKQSEVDDDFLESYVEEDDCSVGNNFLDSSRGKKMKNTKGVKDDLDNATVPSEDDELTVEDLVSIAQEYVKELQDSQNLEKPETKTPCRVNSEKDPIVLKEDNKSQDNKQLPSASSLTGPSPGERSFMHPSMSRDPAQDMLDLLFGSLLKKSKN